jgi:hypothetical protein
MDHPAPSSPASAGDGKDLLTVLEAEGDVIVEEAATALDRAHLPHYETSDPADRARRLRELLDLVTTCVRARELVPIVDHAGRVASERFHAGYDIGEVQSAFNVLEETIWRHVIRSTSPTDLADEIGLLTTVLGAGKDALARTYVSLASKRHVPTLDLRAIFDVSR